MAYGIMILLMKKQHSFIVLLLIIASTVLAQNSQPQKESSEDLRSGIVMFSLEDISNEKTIWLERTQGLDYFLKIKIEDEEKIQKVTTKDAKVLDAHFASRFLKTLYEFPASETGCKVTLRLTMKGETQEICNKDDKKTQEMTPFFKDLEKRF